MRPVPRAATRSTTPARPSPSSSPRPRPRVWSPTRWAASTPAAAAAAFELSADLTPVVVVAVGRHDPQAVLPEAYAARENAPRTRLPLDELVLTAGWRARRAA